MAYHHGNLGIYASGNRILERWQRGNISQKSPADTDSCCAVCHCPASVSSWPPPVRDPDYQWPKAPSQSDFSIWLEASYPRQVSRQSSPPAASLGIRFAREGLSARLPLPTAASGTIPPAAAEWGGVLWTDWATSTPALAVAGLGGSEHLHAYVLLYCT